jgi:hypothetical protein
MRLKVTLFTAAFVMWPVAAFGLLAAGMVWRRFYGIA